MINTPLNGGGADKKPRLTEEQIAFALRQAELCTSVPDVCRKRGISDATFCTWRKKYGGISPSELKHMRQREEENLRLKRLVADLSPLFSTGNQSTVYFRCVIIIYGK